MPIESYFKGSLEQFIYQTRPPHGRGPGITESWTSLLPTYQGYQLSRSKPPREPISQLVPRYNGTIFHIFYILRDIIEFTS